MSADGTRVTNPSAFKSGSLGVQIVLAIVTLSFYCIYWFHSLHTQLASGTDASFSPGMRTIGLFIPIYNLIVLWRTSHDCEAVTDQSGAILFLFNLVFPPAFWYLVQSGINDVAAGAGAQEV